MRIKCYLTFYDYDDITAMGNTSTTIIIMMMMRRRRRKTKDFDK
jgi:hypothetical protein